MGLEMLDTVLDLDWVGKENTYDLNRTMCLVCVGYRVLVECPHGRLIQELQGCTQEMEIDHPSYPSLHNRWTEQECW